jgi:hypothetical protein
MMMVSGIRERAKQPKGLAGTKHEGLIAQVPHINIHRVEVIAWVHWHT